MKTLFIPAKSKTNLNKLKISSLNLPENIEIFYSIQFKEQASEIFKILSKDHNVLRMMQVLGCSKIEFLNKTDAILLIGSGRFHAISLAMQTEKPVYILEDFEKGKLNQISKEEIDGFRKNQKASYLNFLNSKKIGVLISTKPGQRNLEYSLESNYKDKNFYYFLSNEIKMSEFENFPEIEMWVNTACPTLAINNPKIINYSDLEAR